MCTNGVNTTQLEAMIDQINDHLVLEYRWTHKVGHTAEDAGFSTVSEKLHSAQSRLEEARFLLDEAKSALYEADASATAVSTKLV